MNLLIVTLSVLKAIVIIAQKNDEVSSCQILDKHGKDYFCSYYCHYNDTGVQVQKYGHPISASTENIQKTQNENYNIKKIGKTTKSTSLLRYSPTITSKPSATSRGFNINKGVKAPPHTSSTSSTSSRPSILSTVL